MGNHQCLVLVKSRNKFFAKWRIKRLIKWIEKETHSMEWGRIISPITPIDYEKVREYYNIQLDIQVSALKRLLPRIQKLFEKEKISLSDLYSSRISWDIDYLCDDLPDFQHRIYYDTVAYLPSEKEGSEKSIKFRMKGWLEKSLYIFFWDILPVVNYMAEIKLHH